MLSRASPLRGEDTAAASHSKVRLEPMSSLEIARSAVKTTGYVTSTIASAARAASGKWSAFGRRMRSAAAQAPPEPGARTALT